MGLGACISNPYKLMNSRSSDSMKHTCLYSGDWSSKFPGCTFKTELTVRLLLHVASMFIFCCTNLISVGHISIENMPVI